MKEFPTVAAPVASFISANGAHGFYSLYGDVFDCARFDRIFILAGGPGTGKSTLLSRVLARARAEGVTHEAILCSSDPHSLDGVILEKEGRRVGILDGTPPHGRIPSAPGVTETLCDLGAFWEEGKLEGERNRILALTERKRHAYGCAYALLSALGGVEQEERLCHLPHFDRARAEKQIRHKMASLRMHGEGKRRFLRAFSVLGEVTLPFAADAVQNLLLVSGDRASASLYLSLFADKVASAGLAHTRYLSPVSPEETDALYLPENGTLLIYEGLATSLPLKGRRIVADRFVASGAVDGRKNTHLCRALTEGVTAHLSEAGAAHAELERVFGGAMDFARLDGYTEEVVRAVFSALASPFAAIKEK